MVQLNKLKIPQVPEDQQTPIVKLLLDFIYEQQAMLLQQGEIIQSLKDEIARLKGNKPRPKIQPSKLDASISKDTAKKDKLSDGKRAGSEKRSKKAEIPIHETILVTPQVAVPLGSKFKGYADYVTQGIRIRVHNTLYRMERWLTPDGHTVQGELPADVTGHFDNELRRFVLYQYYQCHVTSPLLLEMLHELKIDISSGQLSRLLVESHEGFHDEKSSVLTAGLEVSSYIQADDTGARHKGKNGVCTHIGNAYFAWFSSTNSKSRINFLKLLCAGRDGYHINEESLSYMESQKLPKSKIELVSEHKAKTFASDNEWEQYLSELGVTGQRHRRILTEGGIIGFLLENGLNPKLAILSDDAGQFNIFLHALCWVHAERTIHKLTGFTEGHRQAVECSRKKLWEFYSDLKDYQVNPSEEKKCELTARFDAIFQEKTCYVTLNKALERLHANKEELLLVLERPELPLHNNASESDIREYVKRRRISGSTRSDLGRLSRDTFTSLKKTARKNGISFWNYLYDRLSNTNLIPQLSEVIRQAALGASP